VTKQELRELRERFRLLHQGGVRIDGKVWRALDAPMSHLAGKELQIDRRRKTRLARQPDPQDQEGGAAEFTAEQEIADRQIVISFVGGPLSDRAGFARDLRPIQLAEGTYRFLEFGSDGDAVFEWGPTHYVDHSTQPDQDRSPGEGAEQRSPQPDPQDQEGRAVTVESIRQAFANGYWLKAAHRMIEAALDAALPSTEPTESKGEREINRCAGTGRRRNIMWPLEGPKHVPCPGCPDCQPPDPTEGQQGGGEDGDVDPATHHTAGEQGGAE